MNVTWLGQSGYLFGSAGQRLLIDPFLSDIVEQKQDIKRLIEPPLAVAELRPDVIFITHNHLDHFDPIALPKIHRAFPEARIAGPESVMEKARDLGFDNSVLVPMPTGTRQTFGPFSITSTVAYHGDPLAVGCLLEVEGKTIYISGDTLLTDTLIDGIKVVCPQSIDIVFIVINGRLGNMTLSEAVQLVSQLKPRIAIPMHYRMFAENTTDPHEFVQKCHAVSVATQLLEVGIPVSF